MLNTAIRWGVPNQPKTPVHGLRIPDQEWEALKAEAGIRGETVTDLVRRVLREHLEQGKQ